MLLSGNHNCRMEFCDNCGILLSSPVTDSTVPYCKPCKYMNEQELRVPEVMEFRERRKAWGDNDSHTNFSLESDISAMSLSVSPREDRKSVHQPSERIERSRQTNGASKNNKEFVAVKSSKSKRRSPNASRDRNAQSSPAQEDLVDSPEREGLIAKDISPEQEEIRQQWCRKQKEYKKLLQMEDTPTIAALVSGQRRKTDGSRYYIGGVDISFIKGNEVDACACLTVVRMPDLEVVYQRMEMIELTQPYIPGFLAFREVPPLVQLYKRMLTAAPQYTPDLIMVDGNGVLHPRGFGLACQLGVTLDIPTMGVAKTLMSAQGIVDDDKHKEKKKTLKKAGEGFELISDTGKVLGLCLRVNDKAPNPVYISVGHKITLQSAKWITLECSMFRIPEPVRRADLDSREYLRQGQTKPTESIKEE